MLPCGRIRHAANERKISGVSVMSIRCRQAKNLKSEGGRVSSAYRRAPRALCTHRKTRAPIRMTVLDRARYLPFTPGSDVLSRRGTCNPPLGLGRCNPLSQPLRTPEYHPGSTVSWFPPRFVVLQTFPRGIMQGRHLREMRNQRVSCPAVVLNILYLPALWRPFKITL